MESRGSAGLVRIAIFRGWDGNETSRSKSGCGNGRTAIRVEVNEMTKVYIALGSNVGDRAKNLREAVRLIGEAGVRVLKSAGMYETEPLGYMDQDWFLNSVVEGETELSAVQLLQTLRAIEERMGSKKPFVNGPRLIDLDILLYGYETISQSELQVPHPRMLQRRFVLVPLAEIAPELKHPSWSGTAQQMLEQTPDHSEVRKAAGI